MSNDYLSSRYIGRVFLMNMTSSIWLWRHRLLPPASSMAYRSSSYRDYQMITSAAKITRALSFSHSSISMSLFNEHFIQALLPTSVFYLGLVSKLLIAYQILFGSACLSIFWWFMRLLPRLWFSSLFYYCCSGESASPRLRARLPEQNNALFMTRRSISFFDVFRLIWPFRWLSGRILVLLDLRRSRWPRPHELEGWGREKIRQ